MKASSLVALLLFAAAAAVWGGQHFRKPPGAREGAFVFQGYVDGDLLQVGPEESGRIVLLTKREGETARAGELLFRLDDSIQQAALELAAAKLEEARARLRLAQAQRRRPEALRILEAAVRQAQAALDVSEPEYERVKRLFRKKIVAKSRLDAARGAMERDRARLEEAKRQLETARLPARAEEIGAAMASVRAAEAQVREARVRVLRTRVEAPAAGRVQEIFFRPGEIVAAGRPVLALLPPGNLKIRFYVPEPLRAKFSQGDNVAVSCDSCPAGMKAEITYISGEAEYTPPVIFSPRERARLVYRMEARPLGAAAKLGIGQPVDVSPLWRGREGS